MEPAMLMQILLHTPFWVFGLFAALLVVGLLQLSARRAGLVKVSILPLAMLGLSLYGVSAGFASQPWVLLVWLKALSTSAWLVMRRPLPAGTGYDEATRTFTLPGSAVPLVMMMGIFVTKYAVGVAMVLQPGLAQHTTSAFAISLLYGALSGVFLGRAMRLWRLVTPFTQTSPIFATR
jgi:hypothetical protein